MAEPLLIAKSAGDHGLELTLLRQLIRGALGSLLGGRR